MHSGPGPEFGQGGDFNTGISQIRLYSDLAWLWPIMSPPEDYEEEAANIHRLIQAHAGRKVETLLELGCGGGHNASHLKRHYRVTGVDLSPGMLENSRRLNPEIEHLEGDMRTVRLERRFDAVLIHDAINYMTTEAELTAAFKTAWEHLEPGGVFVTQIEQLPGGLINYGDNGKQHRHDNTRLVFYEDNYDPDPTDTTYECTLVYLIRDGEDYRIESDLHILGIFPLTTWMSLLQEIGFKVYRTEYSGMPMVPKMPILACVRPLA